MSPSSFVGSLLSYFEKGGFVLPPLAVATLILWYSLGYRFATLRRGSVRSTRTLLELYCAGSDRKPRGRIDSAVLWGLELRALHPGPLCRPVLDDVFEQLRRELSAGRIAIRSIVSTAPLAGLLGTVIGMIETFNSLGDMSLFSQTGGIAGGISQALFTTQMGLAVAVPGIVLGRILDRKQGRFEEELEHIKGWLGATAETQGSIV